MKNKIRKKLLEARQSIPTLEVLEKSNIILSKLSSLSLFQKARKILCYISFDNEVYTHGFIKKYAKEKEMYVPVVKGKEIIPSLIKEWQELRTGAYGILEPSEIKAIEPEKIEMAIIPGIAFDIHGYRLGYGKGYFDRLLKKTNAFKIGIAFDFQILENVPHEGHDVRMDAIITEKRILQLNHIFYK